MWQTHSEIIQKDKTIQYQVLFKDQVLSFRELFRLWKENEDFAEFFNNVLKDAPWSAYFWEMPPVRKSTLDQAAEFVLVRNSQLEHIKADESAFAEYFKDSGQMAASFMNLGGDARLLAPLPQGEVQQYAHLAAFVRHAPANQRISLWQMLGSLVEENLSEQLLWVSTSGLGVHWLHIRLDSRPKYYQFEPYRKA